MDNFPLGLVSLLLLLADVEGAGSAASGFFLFSVRKARYNQHIIEIVLIGKGRIIFKMANYYSSALHVYTCIDKHCLLRQVNICECC